MAKVKEEEEKEYDVLNHTLVPKHTVMTAEEVKEILTKHNITAVQLPRILNSDAAVKAVGAKEGDVLKIVRNSPTAGITTYYRIVRKE